MTRKSTGQTWAVGDWAISHTGDRWSRVEQWGKVIEVTAKGSVRVVLGKNITRLFVLGKGLHRPTPAQINFRNWKRSLPKLESVRVHLLFGTSEDYKATAEVYAKRLEPKSVAVTAFRKAAAELESLAAWYDAKPEPED